MRRPLLRTFAACALAPLFTGCIASNVVAPEQRMVVEDLAELQWKAAPGLQLQGLYESVDIRGDAAASLRKVYYLFADDGTYTAAALTEAGGTYAFQTLSGTWRSDQLGLSLDGGDPVVLEQAQAHLRILAPNGELVLVERPGV